MTGGDVDAGAAQHQSDQLDRYVGDRMAKDTLAPPRGGKPAPADAPEHRRRVDKRLLAALRASKLEDTKALFSEVVRRARAEGPQRATYRGEDAVVVTAVGDFERLLPEPEEQPNFVEFLQDTALDELDPRREEDRGRDPPFGNINTAYLGGGVIG